MTVTQARATLAHPFVTEEAFAQARETILDAATKSQRALHAQVGAMNEWAFLRALAERITQEQEARFARAGGRTA